VSAAQSRRAWGWHPLTDAWAARIVAASGVGPGDLVLDLGAGEGALTTHLVQTGARVLAVELHPIRVRRLRDRFQGQPVTVVAADVLGVRLPHRPFRVVASPPYNVSSALLRILLAPGSQLIAADLVVQRAFARRFADDWVHSGGRAQRRWSVRCGTPLPRSAFRPPPKVDSMTLLVRRSS
jgi:23S rRNA (adenine-N6)-dimethyltransferase